MDKSVRLIQSLTDLPLCLDSSIIEVLEAGLAAYEGKALVNSVTAEEERLDAILPLVARQGAAVIGLPDDEEEIPEGPQRRLELAGKIIETATVDSGPPRREGRERMNSSKVPTLSQPPQNDQQQLSHAVAMSTARFPRCPGNSPPGDSKVPTLSLTYEAGARP